MNRLPDRSNLDHLRKQAKDLIRSYRGGDPGSLARFRGALPAAAGRGDDEIASLDLRLHDAQSCLAREHGFASWTDLRRYVEAQSASGDGRDARALQWLRLVYSGDVAGGVDRENPRLAVRMLREHPDLAADDPHLACAVGDEDALRLAVRADPGWANRAGGPLNVPPLLAVTHSSLLRLPEFCERLHRSAQWLLSAGADPNQRIGNRYPPASLGEPDEDQPLSALYGAAGKNHDAELTKLLLEAGADPNDGESLYHAVEGSLACTRVLLENGARFEGTNALYRALDFDNLAVVELLLRHGADANWPARHPPLTEWGSPLLWAIRRRRSARHVEALLQAGADPAARTPSGVSAYGLALQFGLGDVAELLRARGAAEPVSEDEQFIAACARGDAPEARRIRSGRPDLPGSLTETQLRLLPEMVAEGADAGARLMVELGWPIALRGGDWSASALNLAVFRGDAGMTRFLLQHGASWREEHGHGANVCGTLGWASRAEPVAGGDWPGCARALLDHGMPGATPDPDDPDLVLFDGRRMRFSDEVTDVLLEASPPGRGSGG